MREIRQKARKKVRLVRRGCAARPAANETQTETKSDSGSVSVLWEAILEAQKGGGQKKRHQHTTPAEDEPPSQAAVIETKMPWAEKERVHRKTNKMKPVETYQQQQRGRLSLRSQ